LTAVLRGEPEAHGDILVEHQVTDASTIGAGTVIPVIDIFAGPGGLGEGFSALTDAEGRRKFRLALSVEKDPFAHQTLRLRAFRRQFEKPPQVYESVIRGIADWSAIESHFPREAALAASEARLLELAPETVPETRKLVTERLPKGAPWVLIGGPPCQAYSLVGRARNKGNRDYRPELDERQTLYVEYLQMLADHAPPVFVMENVKGLLSAQLDSSRLFDRIREDLSDPAAALHRERRGAGKIRPLYEIRALVPPRDLLGDDPRDYIVQSELYGVPQRRHRVILVGVRSDWTSRRLPLLKPRRVTTIGTAIKFLPRIRSGLSRVPDSDASWQNTVRGLRRKDWVRQADREFRAALLEAIGSASEAPMSRGCEVSTGLKAVLNHSSRGHMQADLERYMFTSVFGRLMGRSPTLTEFPESLMPEHESARGGGFNDRFRVQLETQPSTTITSHISKDGHYYIHPDPTQCRSLTVREAATLQTFPLDYFFCGPRTAQYHQAGNAVPPRLAYQIAESVAELLGV
jgi:DNA (cytosine-5)-methyltransferase 1